MRIATALVLLILLTNSSSSVAAPPEQVAKEDSATAALIRDALTWAFSSKNLPDYNIIADDDPVLIHAQIRSDGREIRDDALPLSERKFELVFLYEAQERADATGRPLRMVVVDQPRIDGTKAFLLMGVELVLPTNSDLVKLCCCVGLAEFELVDGSWRFRAWVYQQCA